MSFYSVSDFYKDKFGSKVYKLSIDAGCTCPNRDGTKATGGCIFCSPSGSGDFAESAMFDIETQIERAKIRVASKFGANKQKKYIAYFQNFSSTYGDEDLLFEKYSRAAVCTDVVGIAIATRPDCVGDSILKKIASLCDRTFVSIELGFQTCNERTGKYIRRFYSNEDYVDAIKRIHLANPKIHVVTHLIFGLPEETKDDMMKSVQFAVDAGTDGLKISCLYVLRGTALEKDFIAGKFAALEMDEYFSLLKSALEIIPQKIVVHRLTGDGPKRLLIAPEWTKNKKNVINRLKEMLFEQ